MRRVPACGGDSDGCQAEGEYTREEAGCAMVEAWRWRCCSCLWTSLFQEFWRARNMGVDRATAIEPCHPTQWLRFLRALRAAVTEYSGDFGGFRGISCSTVEIQVLSSQSYSKVPESDHSLKSHDSFNPLTPETPETNESKLQCYYVLSPSATILPEYCLASTLHHLRIQ